MSIGDLPESLSQAILAGIMLVGRLGIAGSGVTEERLAILRGPAPLSCYLNVYVILMCIYIYIYIYRERERLCMNQYMYTLKYKSTISSQALPSCERSRFRDRQRRSGAAGFIRVALLVYRYLSNTASFMLCVFAVSRLITICYIIRHFGRKRALDK